MAARGNISKNDLSANSMALGLNLYVRNKITANRVCAAAMSTNRLTVAGGETTLEDLKVSGDATICGDLYVSGNANFNNLTLDGNLTITEDLFVSGNTTLQGDLLVEGDTTLEGDLYVSGNTTINNNLFVSGDTTLQGDLYVEGDTVLNQNLLVSGDTTLQGDLYVGGDTILNQNLLVSGDTTLEGDVFINQNLTVSGDTILQGDLLVEGSTTLSELFVSGNTTLAGGLDVTGDITITGNVTITGGTLTTEDICVTAGSTLYTDSIAPKSGTLVSVGGVGDGLQVDRLLVNTIEGQAGGSVTIATAVNVIGDLTVSGFISSTLPTSEVYSNLVSSLAGSTLELTGGGSGISLADSTVTQDVAPDTNNTRDLGTLTERWATVFTVDLDASGTSTLSSVDINGGTIDGVTIGGAVPVTLTAVTADINGGTIDGTVIGGTTPAAGTFTDLSATSATLTLADINGGTIDGTTIGSTTPAGATFTSVVATTADINGGTIDGTTIGGTTPAAGTFTDLAATSATLTLADINGGTIDGTVIGGSVPVTGVFTDLAATSATLTLVDINGGTIDGTTIGGTVPVTLTAVTADINGGTIDNATIGGTVPVTLTAVTLTATSVDINGGNIDGTTIGQTTAAGATFTQVNVDNVRIDGNTVDVINPVNGNLILGATGTGDVVIRTGASLVPGSDIGVDLGGVGQRWNHVYARRGLIGARVTMTGNRNLLVGEDLSITGGNSNSIVVGRFCTLDSTLCCNAMIGCQSSTMEGSGLQNSVLLGGNAGQILGTSNTVLINCSSAGFTASANNTFYVRAGSGNSIFDSSIIPSVTNTYDLGTPTVGWANIYSNNAVTVSDARLKEDVVPLEKGLDTLVHLQPVSFRWKNVPLEKQLVEKKHYGLIAQEVEAVEPELVRKPTDYPEPAAEDSSKLQEREQDIRGVNYNFIVPLLINAVKELKYTCDRQQEQIDYLLSKQE